MKKLVYGSIAVLVLVVGLAGCSKSRSGGGDDSSPSPPSPDPDPGSFTLRISSSSDWSMSYVYMQPDGSFIAHTISDRGSKSYSFRGSDVIACIASGGRATLELVSGGRAIDSVTVSNFQSDCVEGLNTF